MICQFCFHTIRHLSLFLKLCKNVLGQSYSIGGRKKDGVWEWVRNGRFSKMSYFVFSPSEPNGSKSKPENCAAIASDLHYYVYDFSCNSVVRYICEKWKVNILFTFLTNPFFVVHISRINNYKYVIADVIFC